MRIFSSAEYCFRVARRMSLIALAAPVWRVCDFCLIFVPFAHYDEPETLPYEIQLVCSIGADVKQGDVDAQIQLGFMYDAGIGVPKNNAEVLKWYRKAAEQGNEEAKRWLKKLQAE